MDSATAELDVDAERITPELLDDLASPERRTVAIADIPLRFTHIKRHAMSAAHAKHAMLTMHDDTSLSKRLGSGTHALTFGTPEVVVYPGKVRRGKEWDAFAAANKGKCILNAKEHARAAAMANAIRSHELASRLLFTTGTLLEKRIEWEWKGRQCRSTPDARNFRTLVELKTCRSADVLWFHRDAVRMAYHAQLAWYRRAIKAATSVQASEAFIIAIEQQPPHVVTPFRLTERALEAGDRLVQQWFDSQLVCEQTGVWSPYATSYVDFDVIEPGSELIDFTDDGERVDPDF